VRAEKRKPRLRQGRKPWAEKEILAQEKKETPAQIAKESLV
jgi:hypothetical protein